MSSVDDFLRGNTVPGADYNGVTHAATVQHTTNFSVHNLGRSEHARRAALPRQLHRFPLGDITAADPRMDMCALRMKGGNAVMRPAARLMGYAMPGDPVDGVFTDLGGVDGKVCFAGVVVDPGQPDTGAKVTVASGQRSILNPYGIAADFGDHIYLAPPILKPGPDGRPVCATLLSASGGVANPGTMLPSFAALKSAPGGAVAMAAQQLVYDVVASVLRDHREEGAAQRVQGGLMPRGDELDVVERESAIVLQRLRLALDTFSASAVLGADEAIRRFAYLEAASLGATNSKWLPLKSELDLINRHSSQLGLLSQAVRAEGMGGAFDGSNAHPEAMPSGPRGMEGISRLAAEFEDSLRRDRVGGFVGGMTEEEYRDLAQTNPRETMIGSSAAVRATAAITAAMSDVYVGRCTRTNDRDSRKMDVCVAV